MKNKLHYCLIMTIWNEHIIIREKKIRLLCNRIESGEFRSEDHWIAEMN